MTRHKMSLSVDYVSDWGLQETLRELFQNAIDWGDWSWSIEGGELRITSHMAELENKTLLLGHSVKREGSIGKFGEGYKLAMLVLCRLGYECWIENRNSLWQPKLIKSRIYGTKQLVFDCTELAREYPTESLVFAVRGLTASDIDELKNRNLHVRQAPILHSTSNGRILSTSQAGRMYVGGLYVCTLKDYKHGYDFEPSEISLDRDRRMLQNFDVAWLTSNMWTNTNDVKYAASLLKEGAPDVQYVEHHDVKSIAEELQEEFIEDHGEDAVAVSDQWQADRAREEGHEKIIIVAKPVLEVMRKAPSYSYPAPRIVKQTPKQILEEYYHSHDLDEDFLEIIERSEKWVST